MFHYQLEKIQLPHKIGTYLSHITRTGQIQMERTSKIQCLAVHFLYKSLGSLKNKLEERQQ